MPSNAFLVGKLLAISFNLYTASTDGATPAQLTPVTLSAYFTKPSAKSSIDFPNLSRSLLPANNPTNPPLLGTVFAISMIVLAAVLEGSTPLQLTPKTLLAYFTKPSANASSVSPKSSRSLFPTIAPMSPPLLGIISATSIILLAAILDGPTPLQSTPTTLFAYFIRPSANASRLVPKSSRSLLPTIAPTSPPLLGIISANSTILLAAERDGSIPDQSTPLTELA